MGGKIFSSQVPGGLPPLKTPRMPPEVYFHLRDQLIQKLHEWFAKVDSPLENPSKKDYGDIDILCCQPLKNTSQHIYEDIGELIGAVRRKKNGGGCSYAVPFPQGLQDSSTSEIRSASSGEVDEPLYVQVDVSICGPEPYRYEWELFMHAYGDMWQILGSIIRPVGLTATDQGLHVRIEEVEDHNRKASMIFLTREPKNVMRFLGYSVEQYEKGFSTEEEVFEWVTKGRFFDVYRLLEGNRKDTANDRQRLKKRDMYTRFLVEYIPEKKQKLQIRQDCTRNFPWTRQEVVREVFKTYEVRDEYERRVTERRRADKEQVFWRSVVDSVNKEGDKLNLAIRALKRWVAFKERQPYILDEAQLNDDETPLWCEQTPESKQKELLQWVQQNVEEVVTRERRRTKVGQKQRKADREASNSGDGW